MALLRKMTCNIRHPMSHRHPVLYFRTINRIFLYNKPLPCVLYGNAKKCTNDKKLNNEFLGREKKMKHNYDIVYNKPYFVCALFDCNEMHIWIILRDFVIEGEREKEKERERKKEGEKERGKPKERERHLCVFCNMCTVNLFDYCRVQYK